MRVTVDEGVQVNALDGTEVVVRSGRLVAVTVWVPREDEKAIKLAAERFRRIARIPESEVPSG